ncbi:Allantoinase [Coniosporium tulheliwenetii]|uniref:Allantoinase n=1 Tax=Coniosporium tulheliwenetii TaxID=3383036 RepID=A0ACC2ZMS2_9PEZI|nr:Allantoinase [Cladosporium sp. JES 115]
MAPHATGTPPPSSHPYTHAYPITVLASSRAVVSGRLTSATIVINTQTGKIISIFHSVLSKSDFPPGTPFVDHSPKILLPGLVDAHVHLNEPGRTEWEGFWTGTRAAAFGGVTTVVDMPLNAIPPTTTVAGLKEKVAAAQGQCWVDVGFYGGIILAIPTSSNYLSKKVEEFPAVSSIDISKALTELSDSPTTLISPSHHSTLRPLTAYKTFLDSRPASFETYAIAEILSLAHLAPNLPLHIVHLSAIEAIPLLREARARGVKITAETCFHYLSLAAETVKDGDTRHKCCPPIRTQSNQDGLWDEMTRDDDSVIKTVVSDHSPCTPDLKMLPPRLAGETDPANVDGEGGDFFAAWGGISSVGLGLSILWTEACRRGNPSVEDVVKWCCRNTAKQVGLEHRKGDLAVGFDGDVAVFDDEREFVVSRAQHHAVPQQVLAVREQDAQGAVVETWLRGKRVFTREHGFAEKAGPPGQLLLEPRTATAKAHKKEVEFALAA